MTPDMPAAYHRVEAAVAVDLARPSGGDPADAAVTAVLKACRELERDHPKYRDAFQALAERLGYL